MANTVNLPTKRVSEDVLPNIGSAAGAHKVWCRSMDIIRPPRYDFNDITWRNNTNSNILDKITASNLDDIYLKTFPTLFLEKQQKSEVTNLLTPDVIKEIYTKIGGIIQNVYTMNGIIDKAFSDTDFTSRTPNNLTNSIQTTYKTHFSNNEVVNIFELETPSNIRRPPPIISIDGIIPTETGLADKKVLFSSIGINTTLDATNNINGKNLNELSESVFSTKSIVDSSIIEKYVSEYARNFGLEMAVHSKCTR